MKKLPYDERLVRNYCCLLAPVKIILESANHLSLVSPMKHFTLRLNMILLPCQSRSAVQNLFQVFGRPSSICLMKEIQSGVDFKKSMLLLPCHIRIGWKEKTGPFDNPKPPIHPVFKGSSALHGKMAPTDR